MAKKTPAKVIPKGVIITALLIIIVAGFYAMSQPSSPTGQATQSLQPWDKGYVPSYQQGGQQQNCRQVPYQDQECKQVPYTTQEPYTDQECQSVPYTDEECEQKKLVYSLEKGSCKSDCTKTVEVCIHYNLLGWCDVKETRCVKAVAQYSIDITNLDTEGGTWTYSGPFNTDGQPFDGGTKSYYLYPQNKKTFRFYYSWTGTESNPVDPDDVKSCSYKTIKIPTKTVCRDVIKIKEECHSVTKYRAVTKYKEECTSITKYRQECS